MRTNSVSASLLFADSRLQIFISLSPKFIKVVVSIHIRNHDIVCNIGARWNMAAAHNYACVICAVAVVKWPTKSITIDSKQKTGISQQQKKKSGYRTWKIQIRIINTKQFIHIFLKQNYIFAETLWVPIICVLLIQNEQEIKQEKYVNANNVQQIRCLTGDTLTNLQGKCY